MIDLDRFSAILLHLVRSLTCVTRTKLNKLLFYADFLYYQAHAVSLTGLRYRRMPYGPFSPAVDSLLPLLEDQGVVRRTARVYENGNEGTEILPGEARHAAPGLAATELEVLAFVERTFGPMTPTAISDVSHKEAAWVETPEREFISYWFAETLNYRI